MELRDLGVDPSRMEGWIWGPNKFLILVRSSVTWGCRSRYPIEVLSELSEEHPAPTTLDSTSLTQRSAHKSRVTNVVLMGTSLEVTMLAPPALNMSHWPSPLDPQMMLRYIIGPLNKMPADYGSCNPTTSEDPRLKISDQTPTYPGDFSYYLGHS